MPDDAEIGFEFWLSTRRTQGNPAVVGQIEREHILFGEMNDGFGGAGLEIDRAGIEEIADAHHVDASDGVRRVVAKVREDICHRLFARKAFIEALCGIFEMNAVFEIDFVEDIDDALAFCLAVGSEFGEQENGDDTVLVARIAVGEAERLFISKEEMLAAFDAFVSDISHPLEAGERLLEIDASIFADRASERA